MSTKKVGRPKKDTTLTVDDFINADGELVSVAKTSKQANAIRLQNEIDGVASYNPRSTKGMYAGATNPDDFLLFYDTTIKKPLKGRPWSYPTQEALQSEVREYFRFAIEKKIALTVAGLSAWLGISVSTLQYWKSNRATMPFYEVVEPAIGFIHAMTEQGAIDGNIPAIAFIFVSKNYNGMTDKVEYTHAQEKLLDSVEQSDIVNRLPNISTSKDLGEDD